MAKKAFNFEPDFCLFDPIWSLKNVFERSISSNVKNSYRLSLYAVSRKSYNPNSKNW